MPTFTHCMASIDKRIHKSRHLEIATLIVMIFVGFEFLIKI
jgi:hypothetical protein